MGKMSDLARDMKTLEEMVSVCTRCGTCQAHCPLYKETRREADVSRGKIALLTGLAEEMFKNPKGVNERLNRCLLCGSCAKACPSGVDTQAIFLKARSILTRYLGLSFAKKLVFRRYLSEPRKFDKFMGRMAKFQNYALAGEDNAQATSCGKVDIPLLRDRHLTPLAETPLSKSLDSLEIGEGDGPRVLLFTGCLIDKALPRVGMATLEILKAFNCRVIIPENQGCCGIPALASGDEETAKDLVRHHLELFKDLEADALVTACATCTATLKKQWPTLALEMDGDEAYQEEGVSWADLANTWADKTQDISEFLVERFDVKAPFQGKDVLEGGTVTYHDPCHLKKSLDVSAQPRELIRACGAELVEMAKPDQCCGMGGSFNLAHYDLSADIGSRKAADIASTDAATVATSCPACMMQITDMLARRESPATVCHVVELYAKTLGDDEA